MDLGGAGSCAELQAPHSLQDALQHSWTRMRTPMRMSPVDKDESAALGAHPRASAEQGFADVRWGHGRTLSGAGGCSNTGLLGCVSPVLTNTADTNGSRQADSRRQAPTLGAQGCCQHEMGCSEPSQQHCTAS